MIHKSNSPEATWEDRVRAGALEILARGGTPGLTMERLAEAMGVSRMTLHRRGVTRHTVLDGLAAQAALAYREALWPALTGPGTGSERLEAALWALCRTADVYAEVLVPLFGRDEGVFHEKPVAPGDAAATREAFTAPIARLLRDGLQDSTLVLPAELTDPGEVATVLVNQVGWTYLALRVGQDHPAARAGAATIAMAMAAVSAPSL